MNKDNTDYGRVEFCAWIRNPKCLLNGELSEERIVFSDLRYIVRIPLPHKKKRRMISAGDG